MRIYTVEKVLVVIVMLALNTFRFTNLTDMDGSAHFSAQGGAITISTLEYLPVVFLHQ